MPKRGSVKRWRRVALAAAAAATTSDASRRRPRPVVLRAPRRRAPTLPRAKSFTMWSLCFFWGFCLSSSFPGFELGAISQRRHGRWLRAARGDWAAETTRALAIPRARNGTKKKNRNKNTLIKFLSKKNQNKLVFESEILELISVLRLF